MPRCFFFFFFKWQQDALFHSLTFLQSQGTFGTKDELREIGKACHGCIIPDI